MKKISGILMAVFLFGCTSGGEVKPTKVSENTNMWAQYQDNRPDVEYIAVSNQSLNTITKSIAGIYGTTLSLTDKTITQIENNKVVASLEKVRKTSGQEAYDKEVNALTGEDKKAYLLYINNEVNNLSVVAGYLINATKLGLEISKLVSDPNQLTSSMFELPKVIKAGSLAKDQLAFSVKALSWMKEYSDRLKAAKALRDRK